jgi:hypothetical protein
MAEARWWRWLRQLQKSPAGVYADAACVGDPDKCNKVLEDKGYVIEAKLGAGQQTRYVLIEEPPPYTPSKPSMFPGEKPEVDSGQETLF